MCSAKLNNAELLRPSLKRAAIWARVSTSSQAETSLPSQVSRCKERLEHGGYVVVHIFEDDWSSLDLFASPKFQQLVSLIRNKEIEALVVFDRDRLEAKGLQRLLFLSECREASVELIICQGPPIIDGPEGQIVELALAIGKERQVLRARQGSHDGLHDRAVKYGKPVTYRPIYGYDWEKENNRLVPNTQYPNLKLIFDMILAGSSYFPILQELKRRGILSPSGQPEWNKTTLSGIFHNPAYAGRFYALKVRACEPTQRPKKSKRVNSSQKRLSLEMAHYLPNIEIVKPPINWEQRTRIIDQLAQHQKLSQRNANRDYLLRGLIVCGTHQGKQGEPRRYHGQPHRDNWRYVCPVGGCTRPLIHGPQLEELVKFYVKYILIQQPDDFYKTIAKDEHRQKTAEDLTRDLQECDVKYAKKTQLLANLEHRFLSQEVDQDTYRVLKNRYIVERNGVDTRRNELLSAMRQIGREKEAAESLADLAFKYRLRLLYEDLPTHDWRNLFLALNLRIRVPTQEERLQIDDRNSQSVWGEIAAHMVDDP
jgi:site-specific DNA recombinase